MTAADTKATEAFAEVGKKYGYDNVTVEFVALKDFKVKWQRTYKWADFKVSDYLEDAPIDVIISLADTLFAKISGNEATYGEAMKAHVMSPEFAKAKQPIYLKRSRKVSGPIGKHKNLEDSYKRLVEKGLVENDGITKVAWISEPTRKCGFSSAMMKVATVSSAFDDASTPDFVIDYILYHQLLVVKEGREAFGTGRDLELDKSDFEYAEDAEFFIAKKGFFL